MYRLLAILICFLLSACVRDSISVRPSPAQLVGTYFYGDGIGPGETLVLHENGTFDSSISGDLIVNSVGSGGTWTLDGDRVAFQEAGLAPGEKPFHTFALTQIYKGHLVLIPGEKADEDKVYLEFIYRKQPWK